MKQHFHTTLLLVFSGSILLSSASPSSGKGSILTSSKAKMNSTFNKMGVDSIRYTWSGGRNGDLTTPGGVPFDSSISYSYIVTMAPPSANNVTVKHYNAVGLVDTESVYWSQRTISVYNAAGKATQCDYQSAGSGNTWVPFQRQFRYYNVAGKDSLFLMTIWSTATSAWQNISRTTWTYNGSGNITQLLWEQWNTTSSAWVGQTRTTNNYNGAGLLADDIYETWSAGTSAWNVTQRNRNTYSGSFMTMQVLERCSGGVVTSADSTIYSTSGSPATTVSTRYTKPNASAAFAPYNRITVTTTIAANPSVNIWESWAGSAWTNVQRTSFTYNSDDQLTRQYMEVWNGSAWAYKPFESYEFRHTYGNPTGITGNSGNLSNGIDLSISPIPASASISLRITSSRPQAFEASITDISGKQLRAWSSIAAPASHVEAVQITDLVPGVYYLSIDSREGRATRAFIVR